MKDVVIYCPEASASVFRYHINQMCGGRIPDNWTFCHNIDVFFSVPGRHVACYQIPYPYNTQVEQELDRILPDVDQVLILGSELHAITVDFIQRYDHDKIAYFVCGYLQFRVSKARVEKFLDWFMTTAYFYKSVNPAKLFELDPYSPKPLMFDALLGRKKAHRDLAYNYIQEHNMQSQGIVTYMNANEMNLKTDDRSKWIWQSDGIADMEQAQSNCWTVNFVQYHGYSISISQILPIDIYNQTAYTLVCETNTDNHFAFYTEKTIKPILARRLFIILGNQGALAGLRRLGFKTFSGIIDESYDNMEDPVARHTAAMEQMKWLCQQDQSQILEQIRDITTHNFNRLYTNDWYNLFKDPFSKLLTG